MKKRYNQKAIILIVLIILIVGFGLYYFVPFKKLCKTPDCFDEYRDSCKPVLFRSIINNNYYEYTILRSFGSNCRINVELVQSAPGTEVDIKELLEGRSMVCKIPKHLINGNDINEVDNMLSYCHGYLKEGIYELVVRKMYSLVIANINGILGDVKGFI